MFALAEKRKFLGVLLASAGMIGAALPVTASAAAAATSPVRSLSAKVQAHAIQPSRVAPTVLGRPISFQRPTSPAPARRTDSVRPAGTCPANGDWVGFTGGNTDINLEYESLGALTAPNGCPADDESLVIPYKNSSGVTTDSLTIPAGTSAVAELGITVNSSGILLVSCVETSNTWNVCNTGQSGSLDDESGFDIVVNGGTFEVAKKATVNMDDNAIVVKSGQLDTSGAVISGSTSDPSPGTWNGIVVWNGATADIESATIINAAGGGLDTLEGCNACYTDIAVDNGSNVTVNGSTIKNSQAAGILVGVGATPTITSDSFVYQTDQGFGDSSSPAIEYEAVPGDLTGKVSQLTSSGYAQNAIQFGDNQSSLSYSASSGTWPSAGIPYLLSTNVDVLDNASLTLAAGATYRLDGSVFVENGAALNISGTSGSSVTLTSPNDFHGAGTAAEPGDWGNVDYQSGSSGSISYAVFNYGGSPSHDDSGTLEAELALEGTASTVSVTHSQFMNSLGNGIELAEAAKFSLTNDSFTYCTNCSFDTSSGSPVQFDYVPGDLVSGSGQSVTPLLSGLTSTGYGYNFVSISGGSVATSAIWPNPGLDYSLQGVVEVQSGGVLSPMAGATFLSSTGFTVDSGGILDLIGSPGSPVTVTSYNDFLNSTTSPQAGDWSGIDYLAGSSGQISYANLRYGGSLGAELTVSSTSAPLVVTDTAFLHSETNDVEVQGTAAPNFQRDTFGLVTGSSAWYAIDNEGTGSVTATPDYWSQAAGPTGNAAVTGTIKTTPFYTSSVATSSTGTTVNAVALGSALGGTNSIGSQATGGTGGGLATDVFNVNPETVAAAGTPTHYFDVRTSAGNSWTSVEVSDCTVATGQKLQYFNGTAWAPVPSQSFASGCLTATLTSSSTPALSALTGSGTVFTDGATVTATHLVPSTTSIEYGQTLKLTATVTAVDSSTPTGTVAFKSGSTTLGSQSLSSGTAILNIATLKPGPYSLTAVFTPTAHNGYAASTSTAAPVTITKAPLDVTLKETIPYTTTPSLSNIAATSTSILYSGFVGTDTASTTVTGKLSCKTTATATSKPGTYPISTCSGLTSTDYTFAYQQGTLTITTVGTKLTYNGAGASSSSISTHNGATRNKAVYLEATLTTVTGKTVANEKVSFKLGSGHSAQTCVATTTSTGKAICKIAKVTVSDGQQPLAISFAGDTGHNALYKASAAPSTKLKITG